MIDDTLLIGNLPTVAFFDDQIAIRKIGDGSYRADVSDDWSVMGTPNGGYIQALMLHATLDHVGAPDPLAMNTHFVGRTIPGPIEIDVETIKSGRTINTAGARIIQDGRTTAAALVSLGDLDAREGPTHEAGRTPDLPAVLSSDGGPDPDLVKPVRHFEIETDTLTAGVTRGEPSGRTRFVARIRFRDGRPADLLAIPLMADALPPTTFQLGHFGWTPTVEMSVHFRRRPASEWVTCEVSLDHLVDGTFTEVVRLFDERGLFVAETRQLALTAAKPVDMSGAT